MNKLKPRLMLFNGQATATSLVLAEHFGKPHKNILMMIDNARCSPEFARLNFIPAFYPAPLGGERLPMIRVARDGFALLAPFLKDNVSVLRAYLRAFQLPYTPADAQCSDDAAKTPAGVPDAEEPCSPLSAAEKRKAMRKAGLGDSSRLGNFSAVGGQDLPAAQRIRVFYGLVQGRRALLVDSRELHESIAIQKDWLHWVQERVFNYGFRIDFDYVEVLPKEPATKGRPARNFHFTLGMAKQLALIEQSRKGKMVRSYLQRCEAMAAESAEGGDEAVRPAVVAVGAPVVGVKAPAVEMERAPYPVLQFENTQFDIVGRNGKPWLRMSEVIHALYALKGGDTSVTPFENAERAVKRLYEKHADEFTDDMTALVKMQTAGGMQEVRIFSPRGCYALAMFARTDKAKAFRRWVLDVLEGKAVVPAPTTAPANPNSTELLPLNMETFLKLRFAFNHEVSAANVLWTLLNLGAGHDWIQLNLREIKTASGGIVSQSSAQRCAAKLKERGLINIQPNAAWSATIYRVFEEAVVNLLRESGKELVGVPGIGDDNDTPLLGGTTETMH